LIQKPKQLFFKLQPQPSQRPYDVESQYLPLRRRSLPKCNDGLDQVRYGAPILGPSLLILYVLALFGCATYQPRPMEKVPFLERAQTKSDGKVQVRVAVPSAEESKEIFGVDLSSEGIQPVWLEIENNDDVPYIFVPHGLEPHYYSAAEAAYKSRFSFSTSANKKMEEHFQEMTIYRFIPSGTAVSGFAFTSLDLRTKKVNVTLYGPHEIKWFAFFIPVPGVTVDYQEVDLTQLYSEDEIVSYDEEGLRAALKTMPCCTTNEKGTGTGDPLNLVFVGHGEAVLAALLRSGWDETEAMSAGSVWRTVKSFFLGKRYRHSPISPLYVYERPQDAGFQKARETIHERNHLRLWLTPMRFKGKPVFVGQISRDIGVRFTSKTWTLVTHKIDPDVDETRGYLVFDLISSGAIAKMGFVSGVGAATPHEPRENLTGDPYFTDGLRVVLLVSDEPTSFLDLQFFDWDFPPKGEEFKKELLLRR